MPVRGICTMPKLSSIKLINNFKHSSYWLTEFVPGIGSFCRPTLHLDPAKSSYITVGQRKVVANNMLMILYYLCSITLLFYYPEFCYHNNTSLRKFSNLLLTVELWGVSISLQKWFHLCLQVWYYIFNKGVSPDT